MKSLAFLSSKFFAQTHPRISSDGPTGQSSPTAQEHCLQLIRSCGLRLYTPCLDSTSIIHTSSILSNAYLKLSKNPYRSRFLSSLTRKQIHNYFQLGNSWVNASGHAACSIPCCCNFPAPSPASLGSRYCGRKVQASPFASPSHSC